ncbi:unnamed protein product [Sphagnum jensenii]|uniref:Uncharacterized protein n=1 Tax=Sphagnum jensenii TaxID=128206 RepID=A0ABP0VEQ2_9BRYO
MLFSFGRDVNIRWKHGINALAEEQQDGKGRISIVLWGLAPHCIEEKDSPPILTDNTRGGGHSVHAPNRGGIPPGRSANRLRDERGMRNRQHIRETLVKETGYGTEVEAEAEVETEVETEVVGTISRRTEHDLVNMIDKPILTIAAANTIMTTVMGIQIGMTGTTTMRMDTLAIGETRLRTDIYCAEDSLHSRTRYSVLTTHSSHKLIFICTIYRLWSQPDLQNPFTNDPNAHNVKYAFSCLEHCSKLGVLDSRLPVAQHGLFQRIDVQLTELRVRPGGANCVHNLARLEDVEGIQV